MAEWEYVPPPKRETLLQATFNKRELNLILLGLYALDWDAHPFARDLHAALSRAARDWPL